MKRLRASIKKNGLVGHLVWNETTKHIVGGHQRLAALDSIMKTRDYELDVLKVELPLKDEIRLNVVLNNQDSQGVFDYGMLFDLANDFNLDLSEDFGFSDEVIDVNFPEFSESPETAQGNFSDVQTSHEEAPRRASEEDIQKMKALKREARELLKKDNAEFGDWKGEPKGIITLVFQCESDKREWLKSLDLDEEKNVLCVDDMEAALIAELKRNLS